MPFETFTPKPAQAKPATVAFDRDALLLDHTAHKLLGSPQQVVLLYDRERAIVGVRAAESDTDAGALPVEKLRKNVHVRYPGFREWANLPPVPRNSAVCLVAEWSDTERMLCVDLRQPGEPVQRGSATFF